MKVAADEFTTRALVVRNVAYRDTDCVVTLLTETHGRWAGIVRGGRVSVRRVGGALEPFHTIEARLRDANSDLGVIREARIVRTRARMLGSLESLEAAGTLLRWARHLCPAKTPEPHAFAIVEAALDAFENGQEPIVLILVRSGLELLRAVGYALEFAQCVRCGKPCPDDRTAYVDAARGGLVCRECGGGGRLLTALDRKFAEQLSRGEKCDAPKESLEHLLGMIQDALAAHTGFE